MHLHVAADELSLLIAAQFQISVDGRTEVLRIVERHLLAMNIEEELRDGKSRELSAASRAYVATAQRSFQAFNLRLTGIKKNDAVEICQLNALVSEQNGYGSSVNRCSAGHSLVFVGATDSNRQYRNTRREDIGRDAAENAQVDLSIHGQSVTST